MKRAGARSRGGAAFALAAAALAAAAGGAAAGAGEGGAAAAADTGELLYVSEGNRLRRYDVDSLYGPGPPAGERVFENAAGDPERGRDINGMVCALPDGSGRFVAGEDTGQPHPPAGWGVLTPEGEQVGKLTARHAARRPDPYGCAFDAEGRLFTTETGRQDFGTPNGQLLVWFPPFEGFPGPPGAYPDTDAARENYCLLASDLGTATGIAIDAEGRVYAAAASGLEVVRFLPPFPTGPDAEGGCGRRGPRGAPAATRVGRERFLGPRPFRGLLTYSGLALSPRGTLYVASVATGRIGEFDLEGGYVRSVVTPPEWFPPFSTGYPQGLAVDGRGTLYYTDLDLRAADGTVEPGPDGKVWRVRFASDGTPRPPEIVLDGLAFPDGLGVLPGDLGVRAAAPAEGAPAQDEGGAPPAEGAAPGPAPEGPPPPPARDEDGLDLVLAAVLLVVVTLVLRRHLVRRDERLRLR